ncbi:MAG: helix-turn-helix transcriptional regulator [Myxococcales bacterium]|jgi:transcriptional regulator with XRE-family HTH domain|nr:helix-turn-helix transcriptional regulator [Myxococcales bacterium]
MSEPGEAREGWQDRLGEAMEARGLSGGDLARRTGFSAQYVNSLRSGGRGARLPLETAKKIAAALGVSVEWLTQGTGARERVSDVYPVGLAPDRYPGRAEAIALLSAVVEPEVISALRAAVPEGDVDPGREHWIAYAKELARDLRRIKDDPDFVPGPPQGRTPPKSEFSVRRAKK